MEVEQRSQMRTGGRDPVHSSLSRHPRAMPGAWEAQQVLLSKATDSTEWMDEGSEEGRKEGGREEGGDLILRNWCVRQSPC